MDPAHPVPSGPQRTDPCILAIWQRLAEVTRICLRARSGFGSRCHWTGSGTGVVEPEPIAPGVLILHERLHYRPAATAHRPRTAMPLRLCNRLIWQFLPDRLRLGHQRQHTTTPLVELLPDPHPGPRIRLSSRSPHHCGQDHYHAHLHLTRDVLTLVWRITGPDKNEILRQRYSGFEGGES